MGLVLLPLTSHLACTTVDYPWTHASHRVAAQLAKMSDRIPMRSLPHGMMVGASPTVDATTRQQPPRNARVPQQLRTPNYVKNARNNARRLSVRDEQQPRYREAGQYDDDADQNYSPGNDASASQDTDENGARHGDHISVDDTARRAVGGQSLQGVTGIRPPIFEGHDNGDVWFNQQIAGESERILYRVHHLEGNAQLNLTS